MLRWMLRPFRRYAEFSGRSRRQEFWMFVLFNYIVGMAWGAALGIIMLLLYVADAREDTMMMVCFILIIPYALYSLWVMIPGLAVSIRRLHDLDKSGWNILFGLIPLVGGILLIVWYASEGTRGPNRYGPDPLDEGAGRIFA
jgi:uncharacterized membrane protein YhaH (DUF805 family)